MWNKNKNNSNIVAEERAYSVLAKSVVLLGEIQAKDDFRVDGSIEGNIHSTGKVIVGAQGVVTGNIECDSLELMGRVIGDITAHDIIILKADSYFKGEINTTKIEIEVGAQFFGNCKMKENQRMESSQGLGKETKDKLQPSIVT